ncbi:MAG: molybdopterin-dependent oxidoreductase, partial [Chloroflexi bacterium]|nr:molybdopterin-dependent oxidoreductase [Chloroflexota bacterium]
MQNADAIVIMGSNMAECHPVAFRWPMKAKEKGAKIIHVDPRFTRTSAMADIHAPIRAGTDIVFLGALINHVITKVIEPAPLESFSRLYVSNYTNAATLINAGFKDTEDLDGLFSGYNAETKAYSTATWGYQRGDAPKPDGKTDTFTDALRQVVPGRPKEDKSLKDPQTVFQILKRHYSRYTPEMVERVCGCPKETFLKVAQTLADNSNEERTSAFVYAVGWTQHTVGVQIIRAAAMLQLLLGNVGRPGGGILALRGHATIQGSTDIATLYHSLPGYLNMPDGRKKHDTLKDFILTEAGGVNTSYWSNYPKFAVSYFKAQFGDAATKDNDYGYAYHPKITGDHSHMPMFVEMNKGTIKGFLVMGQNPGVGGQNARFQRKALARLDWMVVRDSFMTETAEFWKSSPEVKNGELKQADIKTEIFFLPSAALAEMEGSFTNTQRLIQWHEKAADPPDDARSDSWFTYNLGKRLRALYKDSANDRDWAIKNLLFNYDPSPDEVKNWRIKDEPSAVKLLKEINGYEWPTKKQLTTFANLKEDGTTACAAWIYTGVFPDDTKNVAANRKGDDWVSPGWGFAWPANRHLMYNRASARPDGRPWSERKKYVYWDPDADSGAKDASGNTILGKWVSPAGEVPDFVVTKAPFTHGKDGALGLDWQAGTDPFIMRADGKGWLFAPAGLVDGPIPTHYEPYESPVNNIVYKQQSNPVTKIWAVNGNEYHKVADPDYPIVISTYRLTEHHLSGTMSRWLPWLAELMPELFCEISPELATEKGIKNADYVLISTKRGEIEARALVTKRMRPFK